MLDEYVLVPDIFDQGAYSNAVLIEVCLPHLKEVLLQEALVRDICDGGWSRFCIAKSASLHRRCREIIAKLQKNNRLRRFRVHSNVQPNSAQEWCSEGVGGCQAEPLTGIIASHATKQSFGSSAEVASIERLSATPWWQDRSPSMMLDRKTPDFLRALDRVLMQANSLMFIDPNLDPSSTNYREFIRLIEPVEQRNPKPRIEIHRSVAQGDGPSRKIPKKEDWESIYADWSSELGKKHIVAQVFGWGDFHERYLISDVVGISVPSGFDVTGRPRDMTTWGRLGRRDKDHVQRLFDPAARGEPQWRFTIGAV